MSQKTPEDCPVDISFVLVTRDRSTYVRDCLLSINASTSSPIEVIIIDNSDNSLTEDLLQENSAKFTQLRVRYARVPRSENIIGAARNAGAALSGAPLLAFIDDDVILDTGWVSACLQTFEDPSIAAATGTIREPDTENLDPTLNHPIGCILPNGKMICNYYLSPPKQIDIQHVRCCNFVCRKEIFLKLKGFDLSFKEVYDEADFSLRLLSSGHRIVFNPKLSLAHLCAPALRIFRSEDPAVYYTRKEANLKFYSYFLFRNFGFLHPTPWRYFFTVETGINHLVKYRDRAGIREVSSSIRGKLMGLLYLFRQTFGRQEMLSIAPPALHDITSPVG